MNEKFADQEEWFMYTADVADTWLNHIDAVPDESLRSRATALLFADFADLIAPIKFMKEQLATTYDTARHFK